MPDIIVLGTLDTKGREYRYLERVLERFQLTPVVVDTSLYDSEHGFESEYSCETVAARSGVAFEEVRRRDRRGAAELMLDGISAITDELYDGGAAGIVALGGSNGTYMACEVMKTLPTGFPKAMISVVPAGDPRENVGTDDIVLFNTITDTYLNPILKTVIHNACASLRGMIDHPPATETVSGETSRIVCVSMLGLVEPSLTNIRDELEGRGWELMVFHSNGMGGRAMEKVVASRPVDGVIELAINELVNTDVGGVFDAGGGRLETAVEANVPMVVVPGCIDFVNFWGENVPEEYEDRTFIHHSAQNTLMRTNAEENTRLAKRVADKLNRATTKVTVLIPARGFSGNDAPDGSLGIRRGREVPWHDPQANAAFIDSLNEHVDDALVDVTVHDAHVNDPRFSSRVLDAFFALTNGDEGR